MLKEEPDSCINSSYTSSHTSKKGGRKPKSQTAAPVKRGRPKKTKEEESDLQDCFVCLGCKLPAGLTGKKDSSVWVVPLLVP
ncbi:hypothetical protein B9Z55_000079 [Caenorhabditis nigoni]|uniref:Uncharacterized protein n=1 Tax=Caenorhabditis nigoni TaxID=1611254 RepID=A0A2G5VUX5_9PELO|nr:hypothetical protein B9Z55_000079 [Caenorhabditis nigoni]